MTETETELEPEISGHMSFLEHLDELRKRLVRSAIILVVAFFVCFYFSGAIYNFLSIPIRKALSEATRRPMAPNGLSGDEQILKIETLKEGDTGRYVFDRSASLGFTVVASGASVASKVAIGADGKPGLFSTEPLITANAVVPAGTRLPPKFDTTATSEANADERLVVTTAQEQFTLYVTVSFYAAIAVSLPLLLLQIWLFISPALYKHERAYATPFIGLSSVSFVAGAVFAYYVIFPPAANYLLGVGEGEFQLLLRASDYLDLIMIIMLAMGLIFQMPAITYVLSRIGLVSAGLMIRSWKVSLVVILIVAAVASPTNDIPNMLLFAAPMVILYILSIFIAYIFGKKRQTDAEAERAAAN